MLLNVSYNDRVIREKIEETIGKPYTLKERIKRGGIGIARLPITEASVQINNLLILDNNRNLCGIEMRPKGILVGFRSLLESYALVIPYYKLTLYKGKAEEYSVHTDSYFIKFMIGRKERFNHKFMAKILAEKARQFPTLPHDIV